MELLTKPGRLPDRMKVVGTKIVVGLKCKRLKRQKEGFMIRALLTKSQGRTAGTITKRCTIF